MQKDPALLLGMNSPSILMVKSRFVSAEADVEVNLALVGSLPARSVRMQVRIHWLLNLVGLQLTSSSPPLPLLDFSRLDRLLHRLWTHDLRPGFEVMGNPSAHFTDFEDAAQVNLWRAVVGEVREHYVRRYGIGEHQLGEYCQGDGGKYQGY